jgi:ATP-dependent DNA ligase
VDLPPNPPILPMLAKRVDALPAEGDWIFEPKWDGFRALVFRDGDEIFIQSRDEKPLNRYFPELLEPVRPELIVEVAYDHMQGDRFRHTAQFRRWRTDKKPAIVPTPSLELFLPRNWRQFSTGTMRRKSRKRRYY